MPDVGFLPPLRTVVRVVVLIAAVGSTGLILRAGRHSPRLVLVLMLFWMLSPFMAFSVVEGMSKRWRVGTRTALYGVMLVIAVGSVAVYGVDALRAPHPQAAFVFVAVPPASWLLGAIVVSTAALVSGRLPRRGDKL
ncbi:MAG: hypothetical protein NVS4B3_25770 [Gemmatimonadaceae bacterium]